MRELGCPQRTQRDAKKEELLLGLDRPHPPPGANSAFPPLSVSLRSLRQSSPSLPPVHLRQLHHPRPRPPLIPQNIPSEIVLTNSPPLRQRLCSHEIWGFHPSSCARRPAPVVLRPSSCARRPAPVVLRPVAADVRRRKSAPNLPPPHVSGYRATAPAPVTTAFPPATPAIFIPAPPIRPLHPLRHYGTPAPNCAAKPALCAANLGVRDARPSVCAAHPVICAFNTTVCARLIPLPDRLMRHPSHRIPHPDRRIPHPDRRSNLPTPRGHPNSHPNHPLLNPNQ